MTTREIGDEWMVEDADGRWLARQLAQCVAMELVDPSQQYLDALPHPAPPPPDTGGLMLAIFADPPVGLGKQMARALVRDYPDAQLALDRGNWPLVRASVEDMREDEFLSQEEYERILGLLEHFGIPDDPTEDDPTEGAD